MPIDINGLNASQTQIAGDGNSLRPSEREPLERSDGKERSSVQDTVSFSETAVRVGRLGVAMNDTPVVDVERVEKAKQAILDGTYQVNPTRIAEKLAAFDRLLAGGK